MRKPIVVGLLEQEAANLLSDDGESPEYDRGIIELVTYATGKNSEHLGEVEARLRRIKGDHLT